MYSCQVKIKNEKVYSKKYKLYLFSLGYNWWPIVARYVFLDLISGIARRLTDLTVMTSIFNQDETRVQTRSLS